MSEESSEREAGDVPPERHTEENPAGADPDAGDGAGDETSDAGTAAPPTDPDKQGPSGPPHSGIPGGDVD